MNNTQAWLHKKSNNPEYIRSECFLTFEDYDAECCQQLRSDYQLLDLIKNDDGDLKKILLLRQWCKKRLQVDNSRPAVSGGVFYFLEALLSYLFDECFAVFT